MTIICGLCNLQRNKGKTMQVERQDGKTIVLTEPILVEELQQNFEGAGVGPDNRLPPKYKLKLGKMYYLLPGAGTEGESAMANKDQPPAGTKRIKVVITKQQLRELVSSQISLFTVQDAKRQSDMKWGSELQSIPEEDE